MSNFEFGFCKPEEAGIPTENIARFLATIREKKICMHSILMMYKGKVFFEEYAPPYHKDELQRMYSVSKTFTALAIGILADDGIISLDDKIVDYFPDMADENTHVLIKETTIRELLTMRGPFGSTKGFLRTDPNWTSAYFKKIPDYPSGTLFFYDTSGTRILTALVERLTKKTLMEFLQDRVLRDLGFSEDTYCLQTPDGFSHGGSGVMATTRDMARIGLLLMGGGAVNGKRYISEEFVKDAVSPLVFNDNEASEWRTLKGYGYQIWAMKSGFALKGMGSQQIICVPEKDFIFCCTADTQGNKVYYEAMYDYLYREIIDNIEPVKVENRDLTLGFEPIDGKNYIPLQDKVNNVTYKLSKNPMEIEDITLSIMGDDSAIIINTPRGRKNIKFGLGKFTESTFPENHYSGDIITVSANREYRCTSCGAWVSENQFSVRTYVIDDYLGNLTITLGFKDNKIGLRMCKTAEFFLDEYSGCAGGEAIGSVKL